MGEEDSEYLFFRFPMKWPIISLEVKSPLRILFDSRLDFALSDLIDLYPSSTP